MTYLDRDDPGESIAAVTLQSSQPDHVEGPPAIVLFSCPACSRGLSETVVQVPDDVAEFYREAWKCLSLRARASCLVAFRCVIERMTSNLGASGPLARRLRRVFDAGHLSEATLMFADHVRESGNIGAHSGTPPSLINPQLPADVWGATIALLQAVYIQPPHEWEDPYLLWHTWWGPRCQHGHENHA
jgi:uncharacterized protein DUF4145